MIVNIDDGLEARQQSKALTRANRVTERGKNRLLTANGNPWIPKVIMLHDEGTSNS